MDELFTEEDKPQLIPDFFEGKAAWLTITDGDKDTNMMSRVRKDEEERKSVSSVSDRESDYEEEKQVKKPIP